MLDGFERLNQILTRNGRRDESGTKRGISHQILGCRTLGPHSGIIASKPHLSLGTVLGENSI